MNYTNLIKLVQLIVFENRLIIAQLFCVQN